MTARETSAHKRTVIPQSQESFLPFDINALSPQQRQRYLAFAEPTEEPVKSMLASDIFMMDEISHTYSKYERDAEQRKQDRVIGLLKAAEARSRLRNVRLRFQNMRAQEINHLIACQKTARGAVRLEVFLPPRKNIQKLADNLDRVQRSRVEAILEDENGEIFIRRT
ncbi:protein LKAAEAR1 isoform X2 [Pelodiscus sinensis]|uniref:LKAAEAR motif containing 1 n=1 Tax=Pelodiscus sinensis TaxID=13735 RepID=K7FTE0_PELSI|nr:protein LKAAEAR1 isoform X2 [Pelodiscus sinensis]|eukprot:XP_014433731.1 protein LKAAEAR1 isoform X2 [Pelodiscus sinensis]